MTINWYKCKTEFGTYKVFLDTAKYQTNGNLAIEMWTAVEPFARLTVNLNYGKLPENKAFVDINNCPWAEEFIRENKLGKPTGEIGYSGFCEYPMYEFNLDKI